MPNVDVTHVHNVGECGNPWGSGNVFPIVHGEFT
jgi:hypothetical protein